jgi:zinc protease
MTFRTPVRAVLAVVALICAIPSSPAIGWQLAASSGAATVPLESVVPVDPRVTVGTLPNGLRYYIRTNQAPRNRAELRLVVNAGSVLEDESQRGLAHMVEHMAFNGSKNFPGQRIVAFMQAIGMRFGAHVNAHTGFDETVFQLQVPTEDPAVMDRSFLVMEDWAQNVTFDPSEIDKERGVVLEEWRLGLGPEARMRDAQMPILLKGSRYAERMPIGTPDILRTFRPEALRKFYTDWYRPDLMAVIAVGDFDKTAVEGLIRAHFGKIPARLDPRPKPVFDVPGHPGTLYTVATDPEATNTIVNVTRTMPARDQTTIGAYRQSLVERLFSGMLSDRFDELAHSANPPFLAAQTDRSLFIGPSEATSLVALVTDNGIEPALTAMFAETERVRRFGFTASELERQKANMRLFLERASIEEATWESGRLADEYGRNFLQKEPIPGIGYEYALHQRFVPEITLAEVNALASGWMPDGDRVVSITAPRKPGVTMPTETRLAAAVDAGSKVALKAYVDTASNKPLLEPLPSAGKVVKTTPKPELGITEWELSNGVRVVLRPTMYKQDEILFRAVSPGGTSLASDADFVTAETAATVISRGGLGQLTETALERALAGKNAFVEPQISDTDEGLRGGATRRDLETMFQLIYLTFTQPRADADAFKTLTGQWAATLANRQALPDTVFNDAIEEAVTQGHPRAKPLTPTQLPQIRLDSALTFYKSRFADASDFTFVFVGNLDLEAMKPLVERYLGSLPALHKPETVRDVGIRPPVGIVDRQVRKGVDPRSAVSIVFTGPFQNDESHRVILRAMAETLEGNLQRTLREDLGGTYGVNVTPDFQQRPRGTYRVTISFACDPARLNTLVSALFDEIEQFRRRGPSVGQVADQRLALTRDLETNSRSNSYLLNLLTYKYEYGEDPGEIFKLQQFYDQISPAAIRDAAQMYLDPTRYVKVTLLPER